MSEPLRALPAPDWQAGQFGESRAIDRTGRIVGRVKRNSYTYEYEAVAGDRRLGDYLTEQYAKDAVERALRTDARSLDKP